ncbi:MAG: RagB/SusD family nutrient uptake outer membrane protein [Chitinophagaceae bacterium]
MKRIYFIGVAILFCLVLFSCKKNWLERQPKNILTDDQVWNDPKQITALLANFYNRIPTDLGFVDGATAEFNWRRMADYDDAMWSGESNNEGRNNITQYATNRWELWDYDFIRDINLSIEKMNTLGTALTANDKKIFNAELRFIRAWMYFEMVRRMGGVPLVTSQLIYDYSGDASSLRKPRAKESEVYDFVGSEMDAIKNDLGATINATSVTRANKNMAMALKSRAMLYAASLAKYNSLRAVPITTPGGEVGIPASMAAGYYQKALDAAKEVINSGVYALKTNPANPALAFYEAVTKKTANKEVIFVKDYLTAKDKRHLFTYENIARGVREDNLSSSQITPSLNLVEAFDYLDGSAGTLKTRLPDNSDYIYYNRPEDIFANKDARLSGTIVYPGGVFKGSTIEIQAGVKTWNGTAYVNTEGAIGTVHTDGKTLTGSSGPHRTNQDVTNTGFNMRKYVDDGGGTSTRGIRSDNWWVWIRLGEIYLNAAEAAFELGQTSEALTYMNKLRERAGFAANSLSTLTLAKIQNERRVELAFEDHRVWDLKRWRIADQLWNGQANNPNAMVAALYGYRVIRPGDAARDGKYVYDRLDKSPRIISARLFREQNYYTYIPQAVLDNNPLIVRNPFQ